MKSGTGDDPFAEEAPDDHDANEADASEADPDPPAEEAAPASGSAGTSPEGATSPSGAGASPGDGGGTDADAAGGAGGHAAEAADIPWVLRRSSVKDDRPNMTQFFLQDDTDRAEREFQRELEELLEKDVYLLDLREAAYRVAMDHPEEVAAVLREWGYDYL